MVINYLVNHTFLEAPADHDILVDFSANSKKLISLEVVESLTVRYLDALQADEPTTGKNKPTSLPVMLDPLPSCGAGLWKMGTWEHVKWTTHSMAPVFSLNLDSLNSISNAVKIYCLWLKNPQSRPIGVNPENLENFITTILFSLAELFEQRRGSDVKTSSQSTKRHAEICHQVLKAIIYDLIPNSPLFSQKASKSWELIVRLLLGITDNLLWSDKQNYLADELSERLLNSLFFVFLQSGIYCDEIWKKFTSSFKLWCHRLKSVLVWGSVSVALNSKIASIIYSNYEANEQKIEITFGMHSNEYCVTFDDVKYANYCWARLNNLLPKITDLSGDIFLRALQSHEKIINTWLSAGETTTKIPSDSTIDRKLPNANTIFEIYGESIFEGSLIEKSSHDQGRAIAISIICKIVSKWQYRESISDQNLSISCSCLRTALDGDVLAAATALYNVESVLVSGHMGIISLVIPVFGAILRFIPKCKTIKSPLPGVQMEDLRMCCYRLLSLIYCYFDEGDDDPLDCKLIADFSVYGGSFKSLETAQTFSCFACFASSIKKPSVFLKASHLDTLLASLLIEDSPSNIRFLLNSVSTVLFCNHLEFPELFSFLVKSFEDFLLKPPAIWSNKSLVDTQITIVRILEQWSRLTGLSSADSIRLCSSLINMAVGLYSKANLPFYFRLIISIYESVFSWLSASGSPLVCVSAFIAALVKFMNQDAAPIKPKNNQTTQNNQTGQSQSNPSSQTTNQTSQPSQNPSSSSSPSSPSLYGMKSHKSLSERVFTLESGNEDPRPSRLSPSLQKGVAEVFLEYTDSTLQRLIGLLLQEQINSNYPVDMNSSLSDDCGLETVKYFTLSSSIIVGFTDKIMFVRNSIGKFTWSYEYKVSTAAGSPGTTPSTTILDHEAVGELIPFSRKIVVTDADDVDDSEILLNESNWIKTLENNRSVAAKITPILAEVQKHLKDEFTPAIPLKSRLNRVQPQAALPLDSPEILSRLLLTHLGFLNSGTQALVGIISSDSLACDLKKLDELSARENIIVPIYFHSGTGSVPEFVPQPAAQFVPETVPQSALQCVPESDSQSVSESALQSDSQSVPGLVPESDPLPVPQSVSQSFEHFVAGLGGYPDSESIGPVYADSSLHVTFPVITELTTTCPQFNESVSVIWSEDSETLQSLPKSPSNFVHFLVSPVLIGGRKGQFFRIRILLARSLKAEYNSIQSIYNSFGPLLDGMVVKKSVLSQMIRETSILSHRFIAHFIENSPNPIMKRQMMLKSIIFKNYQVNTYGELISNLI